uniref:Uncharacterized protein n=2 Tax=Caenorhabditis japonica TaxID=281687 RepID=A0A8R1EFW5_CAEJA
MRFLILLLLVVSALIADGFPTNQSKQLAQPFINISNLDSSEWNNHPEFVHIRRRRWLSKLGDIAGYIMNSVGNLGGLLMPDKQSAPKLASEQPVPTSDSKPHVPTALGSRTFRK